MLRWRTRSSATTASTSARWTSLARSIGLMPGSSEILAASIAGGSWSGTARLERGLHHESKLSWRPADMVASPFIRALRCGLEFVGRAGLKRSTLNVALDRHRGRRCYRPSARLYALRAAPRRSGRLNHARPPSQDASFLICEGRDV